MVSNKKIIVLMTGALLLAGCATSYKPAGINGGYSDIQLNVDMYKVSFKGNDATSLDRVQNFLLRRCAELTLQKGYKYFVILERDVKDDTHSITQPTTISASGFSNSLSTSNNYQALLSIKPGTTNTFHNYNDTVVIKMLLSNEKYPTAYNAELLFKSISV